MAKPTDPYITVDYRKQILEFLKFIYKDETIKDENKKEIPLPITAVYPENFANLPCITYSQVNEVSSKNNLNDQFFPNPIDDPNDVIFDYTPDEWNKKMDEEREKVSPDLIWKMIAKYSAAEWNKMMAHYNATGEKLWEEEVEEPEPEEPEDDISQLADDEEETPVESVPSTPLEYPFKEFNPMIYAEVEYQVEFWSKNLTKMVKLIRKLDEYIVHSPARLTKTYTSADLYEVDTKIHHKVIRFKALVDNKGNIFTGW